MSTATRTHEAGRVERPADVTADRRGRPRTGLTLVATLVAGGVTLVSSPPPAASLPAEAPTSLWQPVSVAVGTPVHATSWIAFASSRLGVDDRLYVVAPDGSGLHVVAEDETAKLSRAWSSDGRSLFFCARITVRAAAPASECPQERGVPLSRPLTRPSHRFYDAVPRLSPDGRTAAIVRVHDTNDSAALVTLDLVTGRASTLLDFHWNVDLTTDWSPDGGSIVFAGGSGPERRLPTNLWTIHPDGTGLRQLTDLPEGLSAFAPTFSPDGEWVAFRLEGDGAAKLMRIRADGTEQTVIVEDPGLSPRDLDWGPVVN